MIRALPLAAFAVAGPAVAQTPVAYYVAVPTAPPAQPARLVIRSTIWSPSGGAYVANRAPERDLVACELLANKVGALASFTAAGKPLDADALARCNKRAR